MIKGVYGINVAVKDLDAATRQYEALFGIKAKPLSSDFFAFPGLIGSQISINGFHLNLIASLTDDTSVAKFIEKRGEGFFLLSVEVEDIAGEVQRVRDLGATVLMDENTVGDFGAVNFVHPKSFAGIQVEIFEPGERARALDLATA
ncbi:VOC family protein [Pseudochelatococcus sp. G4_1912]|uniref:VOC family protein n=1 Tax=Pseudochelatococcus sp. G4_1912 TaxID=3114288 RepID=UPI0039C7588A